MNINWVEKVPTKEDELKQLKLSVGEEQIMRVQKGRFYKCGNNLVFIQDKYKGNNEYFYIGILYEDFKPCNVVGLFNGNGMGLHTNQWKLCHALEYDLDLDIRVSEIIDLLAEVSKLDTLKGRLDKLVNEVKQHVAI